VVKPVTELVVFIARRGEERMKEVSLVAPDLPEKFVISSITDTGE